MQTFLALSLAALAVASPILGDPSYVNTTSGMIVGYPSSFSSVFWYPGIPYATVTTRFMGAEKYRPNENSVNNKIITNSCPRFVRKIQQPEQLGETEKRIVDAMLGTNHLNFHEDCLGLKLWAPQTETKKPVLLWFTPDKDNIATIGDIFAEEQDIIVIQANYRTSIFGFSGAPAGAGNVGIDDQRLAVEWVRENIANFGGDPDRITLGGQGRTASVLELYSRTYAGNATGTGYDEFPPPLVQGLILQSPSLVWDTISPAKLETQFYTVADQVNCGKFCFRPRLPIDPETYVGSPDCPTPDTVIQCMQKADWKELVEAVSRLAEETGSLGDPFKPAVEADVKVNGYSILPYFGAKIPRLIGSNAHEGGLAEITDVSACRLRSRGIHSDKPQPGSTTSSTKEFQSSIKPVIDEFDRAIFHCPERYLVSNITSASGDIPVWRYRWFAEFEELELTPYAKLWSGAELPVLWGSVGLVRNRLLGPVSSEVLEGGKQVRAAWGAFIRDPIKGLPAMGWPTFDSEGSNRTMNIGKAGHPFFSLSDISNSSSNNSDRASEKDCEKPILDSESEIGSDLDLMVFMAYGEPLSSCARSHPPHAEGDVDGNLSGGIDGRRRKTSEEHIEQQ